MKWGPKPGQTSSDVEFLEKIAHQTGKLPTAVREKPVVDIVEAPYWNAFQDLHAGRGSSGFGPSPIAWSEMRAYAEMVGVPAGDALLDWMRVVRSIDKHYLHLVSKK